MTKYLLLLVCWSVALATASKFKDSFKMTQNSRVGPVLEGPMYGLDGGFLGIVTGTPYVGFEGTATIVSIGHEEEESNPEDMAVEARLVAFHTSSPALLPIFDFSLSEAERQSKYNTICEDGEASEEVLHAFGMLEGSKYVVLTTGEPTKPIDFKSTITVTGYQYVVFVLCSKGNAELEIEVTGQLAFRNPYGFLPARYYGYLPFLGVLASLYLLLLIAFASWSCRFRKTMLRMQWGILVVILMGFVETTTWFLTYVVMNDSGETSCCPWRTDIVFAMFAKNLKQAVSGLLVLAVALGWGVVRPNLTKRTTALVVLLGFFYLSFSIKFDLVRMEKISNTNPEGQTESAVWAFPVALCDVVFILSIYFGLVQTSHELAVDHQEEKLKMYTTLSNTLRLWGILWFLFTVFDMCIRIGLLPFPWSLEFLLWGFWDVFFLAILVRIALIWRPTETSDRYAYSAQLPTDNVLDEFESQEFEAKSDAKELELAGGSKDGST
ncbi:hypothetical protein BASA81_006805 [Batrachochytrium salamandrivorans]|nr:hypothetical protein BASA81_006805 [Batrachochytrium salamandrivorans]